MLNKRAATLFLGGLMMESLMMGGLAPASARPALDSAQAQWMAREGEGTLPGVAADAPPATRADAVPPAPADPETPAPAEPSLKVGVEDWIGTSNLDGKRTYSDGIWVGSSFASPSVAYVKWDNAKGSAARVSVGMGELYTGSAATVRQPVEAWWQMPVGKASLTVGKYYVPFALQEWEYETKPGAMLQWAQGDDTLAVSGNYNRVTRSGNVYGRVGHSFGPSVSLGLSLGAGKGLSFDTDHKFGWDLDGTVSRVAWQVVGEYEQFRAGGSKLFHFGFLKLSPTNLGPWKPFIGRYEWSDDAEALGRYRSNVFGLGYQVSPHFTLEGGYAPMAKDGGRPTTWLQLHSTWERQ